MSDRHPSRIALAVFDRFIPDNDPLRGDLVEEFRARRSQLWLWRQVIGAVLCRPWSLRISPERMPFSIVAGAVLALMAFETVFFTNTVYRLLFGPPLQDISGSAYYLDRVEGGFHLAPLWFHRVPPATQPSIPLWLWLVPIVAIVSSLPIGWCVARLREEHRVLALAAFGVSLALCSVANLQLSLLAQYTTSMLFLAGLLLGGTLEVTVDAQPTP